MLQSIREVFNELKLEIEYVQFEKEKLGPDELISSLQIDPKNCPVVTVYGWEPMFASLNYGESDSDSAGNVNSHSVHAMISEVKVLFILTTNSRKCPIYC